MYLKIFKTSDILFQKAQSKFEGDYVQSLEKKENFQSSLIARYVISEHIGNDYIPQVSSHGLPEYQNKKNWSISHKNDIIFIGIDNAPIGLDIEYTKQRDSSLLDTFHQSDYDVLGEKNWENFYILWTTHEALIKYHRETQYEAGMYELQSCVKEIIEISGVIFHIKLQLLFKGDRYTVSIGKDSQYIYSLCTDIGKK